MARFFLVLLTLSISFAHGVIFEVDELSLFEVEISKLNNQSLVLFDIDNTLITPKDMAIKPCGSYLRKRYLRLLEPKKREWLQSIIALKGDEELMDPLFPILIKQMQNKHIPVLGFTALETGIYGKMTCVEDWRLNRLKTLDIDFSPTFSEQAFTLTEATPYNNFYPLFKDGVLFTNRQIKGDILTFFLKRLNWKPSKIVFMDDSIEQLNSVESAANALQIEFIGFHYIADKTRPYELDEKLCEFQFQNLLENEIWLSDTDARNLIDK